MPKGTLPTRSGDAWSSLFLVTPPPTINAISGRGGLIIAGGFDMFALRPGAEGFQKREPPDPEEIRLVVTECRPPFRYAISDGSGITLFYKDRREDRLARFRASEPELWPTSAAWATAGKASSLYVCWNNGDLSMTAPDNTGVTTVDVDRIDACASDAAGRLALVALEDESCIVYRSSANGSAEIEEIPTPGWDGMNDVRLAVAGEAVAVSMRGWGVFVTRAKGFPFIRYAGIDDDGPLEFEGPSSDAALYGVSASNSGAIVRASAADEIRSIAELDTEAPITRPFTELTWDVTRKVLYGASPTLGIVSFTPPGGREKAKRFS